MSVDFTGGAQPGPSIPPSGGKSPDGKSPISELPEELRQKILEGLSRSDLGKVAQVDSSFRDSTVDIEKRKQKAFLTNVLRFLDSIIPTKYKEQKQAIADYDSRLNRALSLKGVDAVSNEAYKAIPRILKELDSADLKSLEKRATQGHDDKMARLLKIALLLRIVEKAKEEPVANRDGIFLLAVDGLLRIDEIEIAIEVNAMISKDTLKDDNLKRISEKILDVSDPDSAIEAALTISDDKKREAAIRSICLLLSAKGRTTQALDFTKEYAKNKDDLYSRISVDCALINDDFSKANSIVNLITDPGLKQKAFYDMLGNMIYKKRLGEALLLADLIVDDPIRKEDVITRIVRLYIKAGKIDEAELAASKVENESYRKYLLQGIRDASKK